MFSKLTLKYNYSSSDIWSKYLLYLLSTNPNIETIRDSSLIHLSIFRSKNLTPFKLDNTYFYIDDWDYSYPTSYLTDKNIPKVFSKSSPPLIILKIQYDDKDKPHYNNLYINHNIIVLPFIIFPNRYFNLAFDSWKNKDHEYLCWHTGRVWKNRYMWINFMQSSHLNIPNIEKGLSQSEYESMLLKTKWGLILKGKGIGKNRREVEYMSIGMPLALNYKPLYPFEYNANEHYVYLEKPEDIEKLNNIDPEPFAQKSLEIYNKYYSLHSGLYNSFNNAYNNSIVDIKR